MTSPSVLVCLAPGTEEMEAVTAIDIFVRAGFQVTTASAEENGELTLTCSRGVKLTADVPLVKVADEEFDCIVLPGGVGGATCLGDSALVIEMIRQQQCDQNGLRRSVLHLHWYWRKMVCFQPHIKPVIPRLSTIFRQTNKTAAVSLLTTTISSLPARDRVLHWSSRLRLSTCWQAKKKRVK